MCCANALLPDFLPDRVGTHGQSTLLSGASISHMRVFNYALPRANIETDAACSSNPDACQKILLRGFAPPEPDAVGPGSIIREGARVQTAQTPFHFNNSNHYLLVRRIGCCGERASRGP